MNASARPRRRLAVLLAALTAAMLLVALAPSGGVADIPHPPVVREDGLGVPATEMTLAVRPGVTDTELAGGAVAVSGAWAVVGAPALGFSGAPQAGLALAYHWSPSGRWEFVAVLPDNGHTPSGYFGSAAAVAGDQLFVSATGKYAPASSAGLVFVYDTSGATPSIVQTISVAADGVPQFGRALAVDGDTLVVAASTGSVGTTNCGSVFVFAKAPTGWVQTQTIVPPDLEPGQMFGEALAIEGDDLIIGSPSWGPDQQGKVYTYRRSASGSWTYFGGSLLTTPGVFDRFGLSVAVSNGVMAAGAPGRWTDAGESAGMAYVSRWRDDAIGTGWQQIADIESPSDQAYEEFGRRVALSADDLIIGSSNGPGPGGPTMNQVVYHYAVYPEDPLWPDYVGVVSTAAVQNSDQNHRSVAFDGDTLVVGDPYYTDDAGVRSGGARIVGGLRTARVRADRTLSVPSPGLLGNDSAQLPTMTASLVSSPAHGVATVNQDGSWTYDPTSWFIGTDTFHYQAGGDWGWVEATATVQVYAPATKVGTSISIKRSASSVRRYHTLRLTGRLNPGALGDSCVLYVKKPGSHTWKALSTRHAYSITPNLGANWSYSLKPKSRGKYYFRVRFPGDANRNADWSPYLSVRVR